MSEVKKQRVSVGGGRDANSTNKLSAANMAGTVRVGRAPGRDGPAYRDRYGGVWVVARQPGNETA